MSLASSLPSIALPAAQVNPTRPAPPSARRHRRTRHGPPLPSIPAVPVSVPEKGGTERLPGSESSSLTLGTPLRRTRSPEQSGNAQIFVDGRPVNTLAIAEQFEVRSLFHGGVQQTWEPDQWNADRSTVQESHDELVAGQADVFRQWRDFNDRSAHPMPPGIPLAAQ